jgi:hypothetical protein
MEKIPCLGCGKYFLPRNRDQQYCSEKKCQRERKRIWQREKLANDPEYQASQQLSQQKWLESNSGYYKAYRQRNPDKARRNRVLQRIRNQKASKRKKDAVPRVIAKMDASNLSVHRLSGHYWLIPEIAKMDAVKIFIHAMSDGY